MKITITGASGFVGTNLTTYLESSSKIRSLSARYKTRQNFDFQDNAIIHLAGKAHDLKKVSDSSEYYKGNFELTKQLFNSFLISDATIFIFMSTVKAVADEVDGLLTEDAVCAPKTHYGVSKLQAEKYILSHKIPEDKRVYILRPSMIHGPGNKGNLNLLYQLVSKGFPWPLGVFKNRRTFLSIENLCFVIKELLQNRSIPSGIYQVADDDSLSTNELIELLGKSLNKKAVILKIPKPLIIRIAKLGDYLHLPLNNERLQKLTENYEVSNNKLLNAIGKSLPVNAREGLLQTFNSFRK